MVMPTASLTLRIHSQLWMLAVQNCLLCPLETREGVGCCDVSTSSEV